MKSRWREVANQVIAEIAAENRDLPDKELRTKISEAYPFGERAMHPYKIWLDAVKKYFEFKKKKESFEKLQGDLF